MLLRNSSVSLFATLGLLAGAITTGIPLPLAPALAQSPGADGIPGRCERQNLDAAIQMSTAYYQFGKLENALLCLNAILRTTPAITDVSTDINYSFRVGLIHLYRGEIYSRLTRYPEAIEDLEYAEFLFDTASQFVANTDLAYWHARTLRELGSVSSNLGDYSAAVTYFEDALSVLEGSSSTRIDLAAAIRNDLGLALMNAGDYAGALRRFQASLDYISDTQNKFTTLGNIARTLAFMGRYEDALEIALEVLQFRQAMVLASSQDDGALYRLSVTLNDLGNIYSGLQQFDEALDHYQRSLAIAEQQENLDRQALTLQRIGELYLQEDNTRMAVAFFKLSVNRSEAFRQSLVEQGLSDRNERSYVRSVSATYRLLAELLLEQGRIPEAQQILDLLQLEELREFTDTRARWTSEGIRYTMIEESVIAAHGSLIALGSTLVECERTNCAQLDILYDQQEALLAQYNAEVARFDEAIRANRHDDKDFQDLDDISGNAQILLETYTAEGQTPILIYPFVLEDRLWLVWITIGDVIGSVEIPVTQGELSRTVQRFGELLQDRTSDTSELQAVSKQLYDWMIHQPLADELAANDIDHLVFVNDRVTRYIPMAALYDGEQYLVERYTLSTVLVPRATNLDDRLATVASSPVLGLGLTKAVGELNPLSAVYAELTGIVQDQDFSPEGIYPGEILLNEEFTLDSFTANVANFRILHMATHAAFVPGRAEESYIVLGDGSQLKIPDIETLQRRLRNLHLVVLSACQTALGGANQDGTEIAGLSSYFLEANRAEAVLASLWAVSDGSTSVLMQHFYENLASGEYSKAEALRQAQLSFLNSNQTSAEAQQRNFGQRQADGAPATPLSHPYYWAPFILIGNGL